MRVEGEVYGEVQRHDAYSTYSTTVGGAWWKVEF